MDWGSWLFVNYSNVRGGKEWHLGETCGLHWGDGNIDADPCFRDPCSGDYHLLSKSACIDTGDPNYVAEPNETDLDENRRVVASRIDMGAYEYPNNIPVADAGPNQVAYAWIDGIAEVTLDANNSYDADGDALTYLWKWSIDGNDYETNGVKPTIQLPVGQHIVSANSQ